MEEKKTKWLNNIGIHSQVIGGVSNLILSILKIYVGLFTNCISILSDGYNNMCDVIGNVGGAIGIYVSKKKPTKAYPHGYGRVEEIVSLLLFIVFTIVGGLFVYNSVERLFFHPPTNFAWWSFIALCVTVVVKIALFFMYGVAYKKDPSPVLKANKLDSLMDAVVTLMTVLGYLASAYSAYPIDPIIGIIVGTMIVVSMMKSLTKTFVSLIGSGEPYETLNTALETHNINAEIVSVTNYGRKIEGVITINRELTEEESTLLSQENIVVKTVIIPNKEEKNYDESKEAC